MSFTNRLARETSPYLLQHAHNPVDWYPWGKEALERARSEDRPIFLSVGYSTCYWCHVMERQCFENEAIAAEMNRRFVNIKVDREERPDIDQLYMTAVQVLTRQGGWPMSVFLTPDLQPFFAGTYFPPSDSHGRAGFPRVLEAVEDAYKNRRDEVIASARQVVVILRRLSRLPRPRKAIRFNGELIREMIDRATADFDPENGGFGSAPKFPRQTLLELTLTYLRDQADPKLEAILKQSLDAMARGGIRDHLGGAFHRYSTDAHWLVPHFEIMLYDNATLLWIYAEAHRQTSQASYAAVARGIAEFVLEEMTDSSGGFFTALDAEVDGQEGANYLWTRQEAAEILQGQPDADRFLRVYGLDGGPNFADPHHGNGMPDKNVLYQAEPIEESDSRLAEMRKILLSARRQRKGPMLDRKILTSWNALMIRGLAHAGAILGEPRYTQAAQKAADFLLAQHRGADGGLLRSSGGGAGFLDDYAFLIQALLDLGRGDDAKKFADVMVERFADPVEGGFFFTDGRGTDLIVRQMIGSDSPLPSGNAVAAMAMLELDRAPSAQDVIAAFAEQMENAPDSSCALVQAAHLYVKAHGDFEVKAAAEDRPPSPRELAAQALEISTSWQSASQLRMTCRVLDGFHLNRPDAAEAPTRLTISGAEVESIQIPPGELRGTFDIVVHLKTAPKGNVQVVLSYQACDASVCLPIVAQRVNVSSD